MNSIECQIHQITSLTPFVYKVLLKPEQQVDFLPGQYLNFVMSDEDKRPFSIASAPGAEFIELQIGAFGEDGYAMQVIERVKSSSSVTIEMPLGNAYLRTESERPLILLAGGTGFSYIKSMFEYLVKQQTNRPVTVYWGLRNTKACYELAETQAMLDQLPQGKFIPVVEQPDDAWSGKVGLVHQIAMADIDNFDGYDIYLAGRFEMVGAVRDDLIKKGASTEHMYADAFAYI